MQIDLSYDVLGARIRQIGPFEVHYAGLLKQAHQVGPLELVYHRKQLVKIGPAEMEFDWKGGRLRRLGSGRSTTTGSGHACAPSGRTR
jgi:hypothetical protein